MRQARRREIRTFVVCEAAARSASSVRRPCRRFVVAWSIGHSLLFVLVLLLGVIIGWLARDRRQRTTGAKVTGPEPTPPRPQLTPPAPAGVTPTDPPATASGPAPAPKRDAAAGD